MLKMENLNSRNRELTSKEVEKITGGASALQYVRQRAAESAQRERSLNEEAIARSRDLFSWSR